jgi:helix-turn-helix protein
VSKKKAKKVCPRCHGTGYLHDYEDLGQRMNRLRKKAGRSLKSVAVQMGVSEGYLSDMERGARPWTPDLMTKFIDGIS